MFLTGLTFSLIFSITLMHFKDKKQSLPLISVVVNYTYRSGSWESLMQDKWGQLQYYCTVDLKLSPRRERPTQPWQPWAACLLSFVHKCEQHHQLHNLMVMSRPIRIGVTPLLFLPSLPLGRGTTADSEHWLHPTHRARRQGAAVPRHPARGLPAGVLGPGWGIFSGWKSTWVISTTDSTHPSGLTAGCGYRVAAVLLGWAKSHKQEGEGIKLQIYVKEIQCSIFKLSQAMFGV